MKLSVTLIATEQLDQEWFPEESSGRSPKGDSSNLELYETASHRKLSPEYLGGNLFSWKLPSIAVRNNYPDKQQNLFCS